MWLRDKYRKYKEFLIDLRDRLIHIEEKVDGVTERLDNPSSVSSCAIYDGPRDPGTFYLAVKEGGGIGDAIMDTHFIKTIASMGRMPIQIDFYCRSYKQFTGFPFLRAAYPYSSYIDASRYDLVLTGHRFMIVSFMDEEKVSAYAPTLLEYCLDSWKLASEQLSNDFNNYRFTKYALMKGKNRLEQCDINNILPYSVKAPRYMPLAEDTLDTLDRLGLPHRKYIVINRAVDGKFGEGHPKLWPMERYNELVRKIKEKHDVMVVQIGDSDAFGEIEGVDLNLVGQTSFEECKVILKNALLLVCSEGGLVHMNRWLYNRSVVVFGPTLPEVFGYDSNINIRGTGCADYCENLTSTWSQGCIKGFEEPPCICGVTADMVYEAVDSVLRDECQRTASLEPNAVCDYTPDALADICADPRQKVCLIGRPDRDMIGLLNFTADVSTFTEKKTAEMNFNLNEDYGSIYNIPADKDTYDIAAHVCFEKTPKYVHMIREMMRIVKPNGTLALVVKRNCLPELKMALAELGTRADFPDELNDRDLLVTLRKAV